MSLGANTAALHWVSIDIHCPYGEQFNFVQLASHLKRCPSLKALFLRDIRSVTSFDAAAFDQLPPIEDLGLWLTEQQSMTKLDVWMFHDEQVPNESSLWKQIHTAKSRPNVDIYLFDLKETWKRKISINWRGSRNIERSLWASL
ncbi:hypothetical protein BDP27DRAFT_1366269 [Rhodocollybia butyracea]|uniref:Uncharacterized protein n=1 Tax=Rhodocollybia butyracea TaxID=206335 RepID=A0A9P5PLV9_9AGAR|nr:hypothetical protein BDP27DRAFT_1366269 [Rhodocollybia butyracea]